MRKVCANKCGKSEEESAHPCARVTDTALPPCVEKPLSGADNGEWKDRGAGEE